MNIELKLESGLEVEFTPEFKLPNQSLIEKATWILPEPSSTSNTHLLDPEHLFIDDEDNE